MKMRKIISLLLVAVLSLGVLASCGGSGSASANDELKALSLSDLFKEDADFNVLYADEDYTTYTQVLDYDFFSDKEILKKQSNYVVYENTSVDPIKYVVYNLALEKEICSIEASKIYDESDISLYTYYVTVVTTNENYDTTTTVYSSNGDVICTVDGDSCYIENTYDYCRIENKLYKKNAKDYTLTEVCTLPDIWHVEMENFDFAVLDDAYVLYQGGYIAYYDKDTFDIITSYIVPDYYDYYEMSILDNGNALIQTYTYLEDDAVDFDIYYTAYSSDSNQKCDVDYYILDYTSGKLTEIDFGSYVMSPYSLINSNSYQVSYLSDILNPDVENLIYAYKIVNHHVSYSDSYFISLDNDGTIVGYFNSQIDYQRSIAMPWGEYYVVENDFATYLLDKNEKVLKQIHGDVSFYDYGIYDYANEKIYNANLELVKDLSKFNVIYVKSSGILYSSTDNEGNESYYFYSKAGEKKVNVPEGFTINRYNPVISNELYYFEMYSYNEQTYTTTYEYHYYNNEGTFLFKSEFLYSSYGTFDSHSIVRAYNSANQKYVYKKLTATAQSAQ